MRISDDDDCRAILELYAREEHTIELYVEKDILIHREPEGHGQLTRMLDLDNESTGFISLIHNT